MDDTQREYRKEYAKKHALISVQLSTKQALDAYTIKLEETLGVELTRDQVIRFMLKQLAGGKK